MNFIHKLFFNSIPILKEIKLSQIFIFFNCCCLSKLTESVLFLSKKRQQDCVVNGSRHTTANLIPNGIASLSQEFLSFFSSNPRFVRRRKLDADGRILSSFFLGHSSRTSLWKLNFPWETKVNWVVVHNAVETRQIFNLDHFRRKVLRNSPAIMFAPFPIRSAENEAGEAEKRLKPMVEVNKGCS